MTDETVDLASVWAAATEELSDDTLSPQQRAWLRLTRPLALVEDTALIAAPNPFAKEAIESRLRPAIIQALSRRLGRPVQVAVTVRQTEEQPAPPPAPEPAAHSGSAGEPDPGSG
ncbi:MAG: chromosomal replication initiator protein DnaA, partial [Dehalococcoidia bacterium]